MKRGVRDMVPARRIFIQLILRAAADPRIRNNTTSARPTKNRILATPADAPATPPKPSTAAISANTAKIKAQWNSRRLLYVDRKSKSQKYRQEGENRKK